MNATCIKYGLNSFNRIKGEHFMNSPFETENPRREMTQGRQRLLNTLAIASITGPILFWLILLMAQSLYPGYNPAAASISRLIFGRYGWLQTLNFCLLMVFTVAFGITVYIGIATSKAGKLASALFILMGLAQLATAIFRVNQDPFAPKTIAYNIHNWVFLTTAAIFPIGALLLVPSLKADKRWRPFTGLTIATGITALVLGLYWVVAHPLAPELINPWFGIYERILLSIPLVWIMMISTRLLWIIHN
jgi:hypothetical membrane protein